MCSCSNLVGGGVETPLEKPFCSGVSMVTVVISFMPFTQSLHNTSHLFYGLFRGLSKCSLLSAVRAYHEKLSKNKQNNTKSKSSV